MHTHRRLRTVFGLCAALLLGACGAPSGGTADDVYQAPDTRVDEPATQAPATQAPATQVPATQDAPAPPPPPPTNAAPQDFGSTEGDPVGVWIAPDGSTAFIMENGMCSGMYYHNGAPLDIGGGMTCVYSGNTLVVSQPPNQTSYKVYYSGDAMTIVNGSTAVTFTRG